MRISDWSSDVCSSDLSKSGGASWITSSIALYHDILENHPEYLEPLYAGYHYDLRGEGATGAPDEVTRNAVPVFSWHEGRLSCRFNSKMIERGAIRSEEHTSELQSLMRISYAVFCLKKKKNSQRPTRTNNTT